MPLLASRSISLPPLASLGLLAPPEAGCKPPNAIPPDDKCSLNVSQANVFYVRAILGWDTDLRTKPILKLFAP